MSPNTTQERGSGHVALDVGMTGTTVKFGPDVTHALERRWHLDQVRPFVENPDCEGPAIVARYYGDVVRSDERRLWDQLGLTYGILELMPGMLGHEWVSFPGHIHRGPRRTPFPAILENLHGDGGILLQKAGSFDRIHEASILWLKPGERILLPPGFGHVLINRGDEPLVVAEAHSRDTQWEFEEMARHRGAAYYVGPAGARPNPHYRSHPGLRMLDASVMAPNAPGGPDLYFAILHSPDRYHFLHPY